MPPMMTATVWAAVAKAYGSAAMARMMNCEAPQSGSMATVNKTRAPSRSQRASTQELRRRKRDSAPPEEPVSRLPAAGAVALSHRSGRRAEATACDRR